jgi:hypothetical protein
LFTSKSILIGTSALRRFPARLARVPALIMVRWESTTACTSRFRVVPIEERNYGFMKRANDDWMELCV